MKIEVIQAAIAALLDEEREDIDRQIESAIKNLDGTALLKSVATDLMHGGLASLESHADGITLKRSKLVAGEPSTIVREALS